MLREIKMTIKVGDKLKLGVLRFGKDGDPILIKDGFIIFLKDKGRGVQLNTIIEVKVTKVFSNYAFAERINGK